MNAMSIRVAVRFIGGLTAIILFVVLLTFIFSFLGTIMCAVLAGMMLGATKLGRWQTLALSLIFPAVIFAVLRITKAELADRQMAVISLLCFGAFWFTYLVAAALMSYERKGPGAGMTAGAGAISERARAQGTGQTATGETVSVARAQAPEAGQGLTLDTLQGTWSCSAGLNGQRRDKTLDIRQEKLVLRLADSDGRVGAVIRGQIRVAAASSLQTVRVFAEGQEDDTLVSI
jgi:hypothetical protein